MNFSSSKKDKKEHKKEHRDKERGGSEHFQEVEQRGVDLFQGGAGGDDEPASSSRHHTARTQRQHTVVMTFLVKNSFI